MSKRNCATISIAALLILAALQQPAAAAIEDLPGMENAATLTEWLKLTDDQVTKLDALLTTRFEKVDAAVAKVEAAEEPDVMGFIGEYGGIKKEFSEGVASVLTPEQAKQWDAFKVELEKELVEGASRNQMKKMKSTLQLTDEQVTKLQPAMSTALQKKLDVLQKLADGRRISARDKLGAKRSLGNINEDLEKAMSAVISPEQMKAYKDATAKEDAAPKEDAAGKGTE